MCRSIVSNLRATRLGNRPGWLDRALCAAVNFSICEARRPRRFVCPLDLGGKSRTPKESSSIQAGDEIYHGKRGVGDHVAYEVREEARENPGSSL